MVMITGDNPITAKAVAKQVGINEVIAEVLPEDKAKKVQALQQKGEKVGMVGDGINDAPALAAVDVGFAIETGTDVAIESAGRCCFNGKATGRCCQSHRHFKSNLAQYQTEFIRCVIYSVLVIPIAAGVFYPLIGILLSPLIAGADMALSSVTVVINANRLRFFRRK